MNSKSPLMKIELEENPISFEDFMILLHSRQLAYENSLYKLEREYYHDLRNLFNLTEGDELFLNKKVK